MTELFNPPPDSPPEQPRAREVRPAGRRRPPLPARTGVEWPLPAERGGCDPRLSQLREALKEQRETGDDAEQLCWVLCVALGWLDREALERVAIGVEAEIGSINGRVAA